MQPSKPISLASLAGMLLLRATDAFGVWSEINTLLGTAAASWAFAVMAAILGIWVGIAWANDAVRFFEGERPDYRNWDAQNTFTLGEVAYLWLDREPKQHLGFAARRMMRRLRKARYDHSLELRLSIEEALGSATRQKAPELAVDEEEPITVDTQVGREALTNYANKIKERPPFLFKAARG